MNPTILIGGATGSVATKLLLQKGFPVRAFVHRDDERARQLEAHGTEIVVGDVLDFRAVRRAFDGTNRAYFVHPMLANPAFARSMCHLSARLTASIRVSMHQRDPDRLI
jgi:uncharacterized protein YbjT (DUF2867 family)